MKRRFSSRFEPNLIQTIKLVCFQFYGEYYAININQVEHILPEFTIHGCLESGRSLVKYKDHAITVIDLTNFFVKSPEQMTIQEYSQDKYLIICTFNSHPKGDNQSQINQRDQFGIPIVELPTILEVPETQLEELPELYRQGTPGSPPAPKAIEKVIHTTDDKTIFYLNLKNLIHF